jgi:CRISPR/Cas system-associated exonuclease Cas4 (RecB family)
MATDDGWTSPSDLADYVYCPRSHWYRNHPPPGGPSRSSQRSALAGTRYHDRILLAEQHRDERGGAYWAMLFLGVALVGGALWWLLRP